jgi:hypothetical protein
MSKTKYLNLHTDAAHGWLEVPLADVIACGIARKVSRYSYMRGETVFLEEDADAALYLEQLKAQNVDFAFNEFHQENSPIRNFARFEHGFN